MYTYYWSELFGLNQLSITSIDFLSNFAGLTITTLQVSFRLYVTGKDPLLDNAYTM